MASKIKYACALLLCQPSMMQQVYSIKQFARHTECKSVEWRDKIIANQNIWVRFWTNSPFSESLHICLGQCKHIGLQFISNLLSVAIISMPLLKHFLTRERLLWVRTPNSQVVPNYLVDFFFYVPYAAQTHKVNKISSPVFLLISHIEMCLCEGVTKTAASVDQPALFIWDFNHYIYISFLVGIVWEKANNRFLLCKPFSM